MRRRQVPTYPRERFAASPGQRGPFPRKQRSPSPLFRRDDGLSPPPPALPGLTFPETPAPGNPLSRAVRRCRVCPSHELSRLDKPPPARRLRCGDPPRLNPPRLADPPPELRLNSEASCPSESLSQGIRQDVAALLYRARSNAPSFSSLRTMRSSTRSSALSWRIFSLLVPN